MNRIWFAAGIVAIALLAACDQTDDVALVRPSMIIVEPGVSITKTFTVTHAQSFEPRVTAKSAVETQVDATSGMATVRYEIVVTDVLAYESDRADVADIAIASTGATSITVDVVDTLYCRDAADGIHKDVVNRVVVRDGATDALIAQVDLLPARTAISSIFAAYLVDEESVLRATPSRTRS